MDTNLTIDMSRDALIQHLHEQHDRAVEHDETITASHKKDEAEYLKKFRTALTAARKWTYEEAKEAGFQPETLIPGWRGDRYRGGIRPECPDAMAPQFAEAIRQVSFTRQTKFTIAVSGKWSRLHRLVTWTPTPIKQGDVC